jgi:endoglucanase
MSFQVQRGVNIGGWLSQSKARGAERRQRFTREDVPKLAAMGFDHLRLPVDEEQLWDAAGRRDCEAWDLMDACLDWCDEAGLRVVVDLHILRSHYFMAAEKPLFTDPSAGEHFADLWRDLSAGLRGRNLDKVAYELMNEPVAVEHADWNRVYPLAYRAIRQGEPRRVVVLGSNLWSQARTFEHLAVPEGDRELILTFHFYEPMFVTHYRASWVVECKEYDGPVQYPGSPVSAEAWRALPADRRARMAKWNTPYDAYQMEVAISWPLAVRERTGLPLYCGEFGAIHAAPAELRAAWTKDLIGVLEAKGIAWAEWNYLGGFGVFSRENGLSEVGREILRR